MDRALGLPQQFQVGLQIVAFPLGGEKGVSQSAAAAPYRHKLDEVRDTPVLGLELRCLHADDFG